MCGATHRGLGSPSVFGTGVVSVDEGSPDGGGGGGGTVGRATVFRCAAPESRNEMIGLERTGDGVEGDGDMGLENGPTSDRSPAEEISLSADDCSLVEKKSSEPEP